MRGHGGGHERRVEHVVGLRDVLISEPPGDLAAGQTERSGALHHKPGDGREDRQKPPPRVPSAGSLYRVELKNASR